MPNPVFVICIPKAHCKDKKGNFKLNKVSSKINKALKDFSPLLLLQEWEEASYHSATNVTNELARLAVRDAGDFANWRNLWKTEILRLMHTLAVAEAGKQLDGNSSINSLFSSMNPLLSDRMESQIPLLRKLLSAYSTEIFTAQTLSDTKAKAKLNTMLHLSFDGTDSFYAGNIYTQSKLVARIPTVRKLLDDFAEGKDEKKKKAIKELALVSKSVVVEVNAVCDHSQKNIRIARFVAGLIVPEDKAKLIKGRVDFIYELGPVFLQSRGIPAGEYYFYFSARHLLTLIHPQVVKAKPFARLRGQAFADLQSWFAHRASRPGKLLLTKNL